MPSKTDETTPEFDIFLKRCRAGDNEAWEALFNQYYGLVFSIAKRKAGPAADDAIQETFLRVFKDLKAYQRRKGIPFSAWITRVAHNAAYDTRVKRGRVSPGDFPNNQVTEVEEQPSPFRNSPYSIAVTAEYKNIVHNALTQLRPVYKEVLILYYVKEKSYDEIAEILRKPPTTIKSHMYRAKIALKAIFEVTGLAAALKLEFNDKSSTRRRKKLAYKADYYRRVEVPNKEERFTPPEIKPYHNGYSNAGRVTNDEIRRIFNTWQAEIPEVKDRIEFITDLCELPRTSIVAAITP